ncbi:MAG: hypothetical protein HYZ14_18500 [Bacteroidetes bacterium]|nr:hypothetical protein [Bacteroidota bacterium]
MKLTLVTLFLTLSVGIHAQLHLAQVAGFEFFEPYDYYHSRNQQQEKEWLNEKNVRERTSIYRNKNGQQSKLVEKYDSEGNILSYQSYNVKGELVGEGTFFYDQKHQLIATSGRYKKKTSTARYFYNEAGKMTEIRSYNRKGDYYGRLNGYDETGKITVAKLFYKDSIVANKRLEYEYYADASIKTIRFFEKDKLKNTWVYDCKPEGEMLGVKTEDTTRVCIKEEFDAAGNRVVWRQEFNKKGEPEKIKTVFDKDSNILYSASFDAENRMKRQTTFFKDGGDFQEGFTKRGKVLSTHETIYNTDHQLVKKSSTYKNWFSSNWYSYSNGLMTTSTYLSKRGMSVTEYQYAFYN